MSLSIRAVRLAPEPAASQRQNVHISRGNFLEEEPAGQDTEPVQLDGEGLWLLPGFIDLQVNGGFGYDFSAAPETIWSVAAQLPRYGVTRFLPTIITSPAATIARAQAVLAAGAPAGFRGSIPIGLHLEGPFLNPDKKGAHPAQHLRRPDLSLGRTWRPDNGVRLVTLAPELPGALDLIQQLGGQGVVTAIGHSAASYETALAALEAGARYGTHLFNAMAPLHHRAPGLIAALLTDPRPTLGLIADLIHLHPALIKLIWQLTGPDRLTLVSDAMAALGMPPGGYQLGDQEVIVDESSARLGDGSLAGSILPLNQALHNLIQTTGCNLAAAVATVTSTPAGLLRLDALGSLKPGNIADCVLVDENFDVTATIVAGEIVYLAETSRLSGPP